jgi:hypothetical protein
LPLFPDSEFEFLLLVTAEIPTPYDVDHVRVTEQLLAPLGTVHVTEEAERVPVGSVHTVPFHVVPEVQTPVAVT